MGGTENCQPQTLRVVGQAAGPYTGDVLFQTDDGQWWRPCEFAECDETGHKHRFLVGDVIDLRP